MKIKQKSGVAVVTGASRGVGKGIALALGKAGMTVYVTGRSMSTSEVSLKGNALSGTVIEIADLITKVGGRGIPVCCDHSDDEQVKALFGRINVEHGKLDLLVNNAIALNDQLIDHGPFWEKSLDLVDVIDVGLRSSYVASYYAAPLLIKSNKGLIIFTSSYGGGCYMHGPAYGAQKAGGDKMAADMAVDFENTSVSCISLWLGPQKTERSAIAAIARPDSYGNIMEIGESPEFNGEVILALLEDSNLKTLSGTTLISAELAVKYGVTDGDKQPTSFRSVLGAPISWNAARVT